MGGCIYACTHKAFTAPPDPFYRPLFCGAAIPGRESFGYLRDETGENISLKNPYYSELSGMYWIWKNDTENEILGLCHYRRYLLDRDRRLFTEKTAKKALTEYDAVTTKRVILDHPYREAFGGRHNLRDFELLEQAVGKLFPEYMDDFCEIASGRETYFGNMLIAKRDLFSEYSAWLFALLSVVEKDVDMTGYNDYQKRLYGFLSELLLMVYLKHNGLNVLECDVAVLGGKKETGEVLEAVAGCFRNRDLDGAARVFMDCYEKRPDILMEASDVDGKLKLVTQMLATFRAEQEQTGHNYLERERELSVLFTQFRDLNTAVKEAKSPGFVTIKTPLSEIAIRIAEKLK